MGLIDLSQIFMPGDPDDAATGDTATGFAMGRTSSVHVDGPWSWSTSSAPPGATPTATAQVARAVAARVLGEQGLP